MTLFALYALGLSLFTSLSIYVLESEIKSIEREIDTLLEEFLKLKKQMNEKR
jgi:hypothetical protein